SFATTGSDIKEVIEWEERVLKETLGEEKDAPLAALQGKEWLLRAAVRVHAGRPDHPEELGTEIGRRLRDRLVKARVAVLRSFPKEDAVAASTASAWLKVGPADAALQAAAGATLLEQARVRWSSGAGAAARLLLDEAEGVAVAGEVAKLRDEMQ